LSKKNKRHKTKHPPVVPQQPNPLANDNPTKNIEGVIAQASSYSGPIPPPDLLAKFAEIIPNGADRILKMAENQSKHRQCIEKWAVIGGTILSHFGVACAMIIVLGTLYFGSQLIREGHTISGSIFAGSGLLGLVTAFIYGTRSRREERKLRDQRNRELIRQK